MEEQFAAEGLSVLGFLSNDFNQAGSDDQIEACTEQYGVTFDQFSIAPVTGSGAQPVFDWILDQANPGPASTVEPQWNFHKYLIGRDGTLVATWGSSTYPGDDPNNPNDSFETNPIVVAIQAELAKPAP